MQAHTPNDIPARTRVALSIVAMAFLAYAVAELAFGYTYFPSRRGYGLLLSGVPTVMVALSATLLSVLAVSVVIDHYDRRPNEARYNTLQGTLGKIAVLLLVSAPFAEIIRSLLPHSVAIDALTYRGFAADIPLDARAYSSYARAIDGVLHGGFAITLFVLGLACGIAGHIVDRIWKHKARKLTILLYSLLLVSLSSFGLLWTARQVVSGEASIGRSAHKHSILAAREPAKFNAVILTRGSLSILMLSLGIAGLVMAVQRDPDRDR